MPPKEPNQGGNKPEEKQQGGQGNGKPPLDPPPASPPPAPPAPAPRSDSRIRVVCALPNAGNVISEILFASVEIEGAVIHVSELVEPSRVARLLSIDGYSVFEGNEETAARAIEDALDRSRRQAPEGGGLAPRDLELQRQLDEHQRSNMAMSRENQELRAQVDTQAQEILRLKGEVESLKSRLGVKG